MKKILITGKNSYIGNHIEMWLARKPQSYSVDKISVRDNSWKKLDFSVYDVVLNLCAIVHRFDNPDEKLFFRVNKDLAVEIANKAKSEGVEQFIQMSTLGVFGIELGEMNSSMGFNPQTPYEKSKYEADLELEKLRDDSFKVCIIRPPMIYGNECKGNFPKLVNFAINFPIFPSKKNRRDALYIENVCDFIEFSIDKGLNEICYPRDNERIAVADMVKQIATLNGKNILLLGALNPFVFLCYRYSRKLRSVFGDNYCTDDICKNNEWIAPYKTDEALKRMFKG